MITPNFYTKKINLSSDYGQFIIEPLAPSFGQSLGNALRRTLLSSLKGAAISFVKIEGVPHLFTTIKGVKESALEIVLALKQLRFKTPGEGKFKVNLSIKGKKKIYGKDIEGEATVVNGDLYLAEITDDKTKLEIEAIVETGYGYVMAEEQEAKEFGFIAIDSSFSPVKKVNFQVEKTRVGRKTNYDKLILEIWTDGSVSPAETLKQAATILANHFSRILSGEDNPKERKEDKINETEKNQIDKKFYDLIIDELNLPSRVINTLLKENIETVADLIKIGKERLVGLRGLGKKSIDLIEEELKKLGVGLI